MYDKEDLKKRDEYIYSLIDKFKMEDNSPLTREQIFRRMVKGMVCTNLAHVLTDAANSLMMDAESQLKPMRVKFKHIEKKKYTQMLNCIEAAKKYAYNIVVAQYQYDDADYFANDSDWWYSLIRLVQDKTDSSQNKSTQLIDFLLGMKSESNVFNIQKKDF